MTDTDMLYMAGLEKRNAELTARVAELEDELRKAKELLRAALDDISWLNELTVDGEGVCLIEKELEMETCLECPLNTGDSYLCGWKHQAAALALIGKDTNVPAREESESNA